MTEVLADAADRVAPAADPRGLDDAWFRSVARRFATGVTVVTSCADGVPTGMTVNSFATVSLAPTLLLLCLGQRCRLIRAIRRCGVFSVTILAADQRDCARRFADAARPDGAAGFAGIPTHPDPATGCPLLSDGIAYFGCATYGRHPYGDHVVLIGEVRSCGLLRSASPLVFADGGFQGLDCGTGSGTPPVRAPY